jgi:hypothetical protein
MPQQPVMRGCPGRHFLTALEQDNVDGRVI